MADDHAEDNGCQDVAGIMQSQNGARQGHQQREGNDHPEPGGMMAEQEDREGHGVQGMPGRKAVFIQRRYWAGQGLINGAGSTATGSAFEPFVQQQGQNARACHVQTGQHSGKTIPQGQNQHQGIPEYPVTEATDPRKESAEDISSAKAVEPLTKAHINGQDTLQGTPGRG